MNFPDISVNGIVVKQETQVAALKLFLKNDSRQAKYLETFLEDLGVPVYHGISVKDEKPVSMRVADRLLQRARKADIIKFVRGRWEDSSALEAFMKGDLK